MQQLSYFDGTCIKRIVKDNKNVILLDFDEELKMAFVGYIDGKVDIIKSSYIKLEYLPLGMNIINNKECFK